MFYAGIFFSSGFYHISVINSDPFLFKLTSEPPVLLFLLEYWITCQIIWGNPIFLLPELWSSIRKWFVTEWGNKHPSPYLSAKNYEFLFDFSFSLWGNQLWANVNASFCSKLYAPCFFKPFAILHYKYL